MQFKTRNKRKVIINITSLIDVLFLLLIFLMVSSTFLEQPGIKLELPKADSAIVYEQKDYILSVNRAGQMFLNEREVVFGNLEAEIRTVLDKMKDRALILKADQDVSHGVVVRVMDIVKKSGIKKLIIGTKVENK